MPSVNVEVIEDGLKSILVNLQRAYSMTYRLNAEDAKKKAIEFLDDYMDQENSHAAVIGRVTKVTLQPLKQAINICKEEDAPKTYKMLLEWRERMESQR